MLTGAGLLRLAYAANILILVPICWNMFLGSGVASVFEGKVEESAGLRLLVGSLWLAILVGSAAGLYAPRFFAPIILIQIFYKTLWLLVFALPLIAAGKSDQVPWGIAATFIAIVLSYPFLFWFSGVWRQAL
ncbi:hypothetical protein [Parasphingorhabdus cellanae]|uniref:Polysaccharide biosynthesis protein C-terminal domain-containing protein n=1 Tax=Parasphingorhabdus cellanae TaxID=2806553 RepID=A0ABX7T8B9_9SPHN|nr:hypothetical protein [Parasphingorhabdus cellanae]QTD56684.1 hypothetical protein J4G78_03630 [Parasphingorhabdus cellanae]